ncbi:MAG: cadherin-like domain-containing protein [Mycobacterium sp.]|nr:cadherin-like domain-containing protein [Mycobacterium sp.]
MAVPISPKNSAPVMGTSTVGSPNAATGVVSGTVSATDGDGDTLIYSAPATTTKGAVIVNSSSGAFTYTPSAAARNDAAAAGATEADQADAFTVTVSDGYGGRASIPVNVVVSPNHAPVAGTPTMSTNPATGVVTGSVNAVDPDADALTYAAAVTPTAKGSATVTASGAFTYTPTAAARHAAAKIGATTSVTTDSFTVTVADTNGASSAIPVTVTVSPSNIAPVGGTPTAAAPNPSTGVVTGSVSATDADSDPVTYGGSTTTSKGTVTVNPNGSFTYTPTAEAQRNAAMPGTPAANLSDTFTVTVTDGYGGSISVPVSVSVNPLVSYYVTGDVRRDPETGRIALRTVFPPEQAQPGTGNPGYLNWLIASPNAGALIGFPADVQNWDNLYLVGSAPKTTVFNPAVSYPEGAVLRNPQNGAVAIRTIFPEDQGPNLANMAWLVATTSQGGLHVPTSSVQTWDVLFAPNRAPVAGSPVVGPPNLSTGVVTGSVSVTDPDGDNLTYSGSTTTSKGSVTIAANGSFTYTPTYTARQNAGKTGATAADKTDNFTVTVTDVNGGTASAPVEVVVRSLLKTGDIIQQPGGTWRAIYAPNVTSWGSNWLGVNPGNGGVWLSDSDVSGWLDVVPPTGAETAGSGPYSAGDVKVPAGSVEGSVTWFAVKTGAPLSNSHSWMTCSVTSACNTASGNDLIAGSPVAQWVDLKLSS